jgi:hypothetical protein
MRPIDWKKIIIVLAFLASTGFFLWQHTTGVGWDFAAYSLNARYWFHGGPYFQLVRPPLPAVIIGLFSLISGAWAEFLFIAAAGLLFAYSSVRLARALGVPPALFYVASLTPFVLMEGLKNGTELLCLALLELAIASLGSAAAPVFLGLAVLTRYPAAGFVVLLLFTKDARKIIRDLLIAAAVAAPWLLYNQLAFGHWAASLMDSYAMNMKFRSYMAGPFKLSDVGAVGTYLLPLFALGFVLAWRRSGRWTAPERPFWIMAAFLTMALLSYARVQQKQTRYLFDLTLPLAYFAAAGLTALDKTRWKAAAAGGLAVLCAGSMALTARREPVRFRLDDVRVYKRVLAELTPRLGDCRLATNAWDFLNYFGRRAEPFPMENVIEERIAEGVRLLLFKNMSEPKLERALIDRLPVMAETPAYVLIGKSGTCAPARRYVYRYLELKKENVLKTGGDFPDSLFDLIFRRYPHIR